MSDKKTWNVFEVFGASKSKKPQVTIEPEKNAPETQPVSSQGRRNFFERMEQEIDYDREYRKMEDLLFGRGTTTYYNSLDYKIRDSFLQWNDRGTYTSFSELREAMGFPVRFRNEEPICIAEKITLDDYLTYCEMVINILTFLEYRERVFENSAARAIIQNIKRNLEKIGMCVWETEDRRFIITQKSPEAISVADVTTPNIANAVMEYNHYLLKGNLVKKRSLLTIIADDLEPKRKELQTAKFAGESDLFFLFNNVNIRHNNIDPNGANYKPRVATMSKEELEKWYDETYQLALMAYLYLENVERADRIKKLKQEFGSTR